MILIDSKTIKQSCELPNGDTIVLLDREKVEPNAQQRNIYRVSISGNIKWQVADYQPIPALSTFTNISLIGEVVEAYNFDGGCYKISIEDGSICGSELSK